jgi:hypothetical protein
VSVVGSMNKIQTQFQIESQTYGCSSRIQLLEMLSNSKVVTRVGRFGGIQGLDDLDRTLNVFFEIAQSHCE